MGILIIFFFFKQLPTEANNVDRDKSPSSSPDQAKNGLMNYS